MGLEAAPIAATDLKEIQKRFRNEVDLVLNGELDSAMIPVEAAPEISELKAIANDVVVRAGAIVRKTLGESGESVLQKPNKRTVIIKPGNEGEVIEVRRIPDVVIPHVPADPELMQEKARDGKLEFAFTPTKTMVMAAFENRQWSDTELVPAGKITIGTTADRYGQALFGGNRMLRLEDGRVALFRPDEHAKRFIGNMHDLMVPELDVDTIVQNYVDVGKANIAYLPPHGTGSMYIAPGVRATREQLGVHTNIEFLYTVDAVPAGKIFSGPSELQTKRGFHRSAGYIKASGNYSITFRDKDEAKKAGYNDIVTADKRGRYVAELSSSNVFFIDEEGWLVTPRLNNSILPGITRKSIIQIAKLMAKELGIKGVKERNIKFSEVGNMREAFSTGTGVTINSVRSIDDHDFEIAENHQGPVAAKIMQIFEDILAGKYMDHPVFGPWLKVIA